VVHQNISSLKNKVDRLEVFFENEGPDIMCFSEHHLRDHERRTASFQNYYEGSIFCRQKKTRGGTVLLKTRSKVKV